MRKYLLFSLFLTLSFLNQTTAQHSVAREWNEVLLEAIRSDLARPTVHARNLFHVSAAMYDAWAVFDDNAEPYLLGQTFPNFSCPFNGFTLQAGMSVEEARERAISFAAYRLLRHRFSRSPGRILSNQRFDNLLTQLGYNRSFVTANYASGAPEALGNYIASCYINYGRLDGSNEDRDYTNQYYQPINPPLVTQEGGNPDILNPNRWQPLTLDVFIDQSGNVIPFNTPPFLSPEWGNVTPFSLTNDDMTVRQRDNQTYNIYHDPGMPPMTQEDGGGMTDEWRWGFQMVSIWGSHLDSNDPTTIDISPGNQGNFDSNGFPQNITELRNFYIVNDGGDISTGRAMNPMTGQPYAPNVIKRGDYGRILAEFWADGPESETPPGHWYTILNYVSDHPEVVKKFAGEGELMNDLEWDIKSYFMLGGAMHDCAISAWGIKGFYDYIRPVSAIRFMAEKGQSSDPMLPNYDPQGFDLIPGYIELVEAGDPLAMNAPENIGKIKLYSWKGPDYINNPQTDEAGVGWILAENWWPYQRPSFVTPNFAGYISGHSTYSRGAAEILTMLTGTEYFPGGLGVFEAPRNQFLVFEQGPSVDIQLQWATYRDASDQCSLSRIWGGIHPPADDIPGRIIGERIGKSAFELAKGYFYKDKDGDGYLSYLDCDDEDPNSFPGAPEVCDGKDNNCDGNADEGLQLFTYYLDIDNDGFGDAAGRIDTCLMMAPMGYVTNDLDCIDNDPNFNPNIVEVCDGLDNDCNGIVDDMPIFTYWLDNDGDGFGDANSFIDTCLTAAPTGYCTNDLDCNDFDDNFHPNIPEICDGQDNDCNNVIDDGLTNYTYYRDSDGDGFGGEFIRMDTCQSFAPNGFVENKLDCNDQDPMINPDSPEICDDIDNDCNGLEDDNIPYYNYYTDLDGDGFGNALQSINICHETPPTSFVTDNTDCNDDTAFADLQYPGNEEVADNGIDEDCSGVDLYLKTKLFPNPFGEMLTVRYASEEELNYQIVNIGGQLIVNESTTPVFNEMTIQLPHLASGIYLFVLRDKSGKRLHTEKLVRK